MPLEKLGAPPFLTPADVEQDDLLEIISEPYIVSAEKSKWGKKRGRANVRSIRSGAEYRWTMNTTTWDRLVDAFGTEPNLWIGRKVKVKLENRDVGGVEKTVIFGAAYKEPQKKLDIQPKQPAPAVEHIVDLIAHLTPESKKALEKALEETVEAK